jgi:ElaB/YqjD/DUF883 family membrane-anchored ribosome-binding protein
MTATAEALAYKADIKARTKERFVDRLHLVGERVAETADTVLASPGAAGGHAVASAGAAADRLTASVEAAITATTQTTGKELGAMTDSASTHMSNVTSAASQTAKQATDVAKQGVGMVRENPLGLAVGAAAAGFLIGALLPSTKMEDDKLGQASDQVKQAATEMGHEALERGKTVAQEATTAALDAAKSTGQEQVEDFASSAQQKTESFGAPAS